LQTAEKRGRAPEDLVPRRRGTGGWLLLSSVLLAACASITPPVAVPVEAPPQPSLQALLQQGEAASQQGDREQARSRYREAAKYYPTSKQPWEKLAEGYFESGEYGNAILAAQEVLQRDPQERFAHSILAVAGLRVSAASLTALRDPRTDLPASSREEAVMLTQTLRETLGEKALVLPLIDAAPASLLAPSEPSRQLAPRRPRPAPAPALPAPAAAARPAPTASANPFDKLK
jgi:Tetratricopeptide repeat